MKRVIRHILRPITVKMMVKLKMIISILQLRNLPHDVENQGSRDFGDSYDAYVNY